LRRHQIMNRRACHRDCRRAVAVHREHH
jgi:hypothetical protein